MNDLTPVSETSKSVAVVDERFEREDLQSWHKDIDTDRTPILKMARRVFFGVFVIGGIWAATAPLGGAITSKGRIVAEDRNRVIQHLEGGILAELPVREGTRVSKGDVLAVLDDTQVGAMLRSNKLQRAILRIQLARRRAEVQELEAVQFPRDIDPDVANHPRVLEAIASQEEEFQAQRRFILAGDEIIDAQIRGQEGDIEGLGEVMVAMDRQLELYQKELDDYRELLARGRIDRPRVFATERQVVDLKAKIARVKLDIKAAENNIETLGNEKRQNRLKFSQQSHQNVVELQKNLSNVDSSITRLTDMRRRLVIRSPENGTVFQIATKTLGAVIRPGDPIMEIFPEDDLLTIETKLEERHRTKVEVGQEAAVVFPGNRVQSVKQYNAVVTYLSSDIVIDERDARDLGHYVLHVKLTGDPGEIENFLPGKQAEVFVKTEPQTFIDIIISPVLRFTDIAFNE